MTETAFGKKLREKKWTTKNVFGFYDVVTPRKEKTILYIICSGIKPLRAQGDKRLFFLSGSPCFSFLAFSIETEN